MSGQFELPGLARVIPAATRRWVAGTALILLAAAAPAQDPPPPPTARSLLDQPEGYTCPMHPSYLSEQPGTCPICGMDLVPVDTGGDGGGEAGGGDGIVVPAAMIQTMGVRIRAAAPRDFERRVRAFGSIQASSRLETVVAARVEGWIETLAVTAEGDVVAQGALLYRVYSPELISAQQDHLAALRAGSPARIASGARRLRSLGMQQPVIDTLERERQLIEQVPFFAEGAGVVSLLETREGAYLRPGDLLMRLQAYDEVWVIAAVAEKDLPAIGPGMPASIDFPTRAIGPARGVVDYVYPQIDPRTRTGRVRVVLANADGALKPGAYADVEFTLDERRRLAVPSEAILRDARGTHVIVSLGAGRFAGRRVHTGIAEQGHTEILHGLEAGENVVVSGQFMLDSEASLREAFGKLEGAHGGHSHGENAPTGEDQSDYMPPDGMQPEGMEPDGMPPGEMPHHHMEHGDTNREGERRADPHGEHAHHGGTSQSDA